MTASELHDLVSARLRAGDQRYTSGRRRLVTLLTEGDGPMTIPQVLDADASLAQSSVYRNLAVLEEAGVVARIVTADDFARYELAEDLTEHHHHLICAACGEVADFSLEPEVEDQLEGVLREVAAQASFTMEHHRLDLVGVCGSCR